MTDEKESRINVPVVAAYGMLAYRLAFHAGSEVTFNPTLFFLFLFACSRSKSGINAARIMH